ncbi:hypothetical protein GCM10011386_10260 [Parapedobacter defluvii]|uniref:Uncharacterized protein n=1 Tax=Parapedobacter defluvii TaxID=2045106 RepID=A0ABQ1L7Q4_9SPHI|nr:DUF6266 family protein [Parapedobacter defluvii]GGC20303.1 hypothetical protein GCM10011386_10260 [Parapedobacter defluvii]
MATFKEGINGPFKGKVGSVIGSSWRKIHYMKGMRKVKRNKPKPSDKQAVQHHKFRLLNRFFMPIARVLDIGFRGHTSRATAKNVAFGYNYDHAFVEDGDQIKLNYPALKFSHGSLYTAGAEQASLIGEGIKVIWDPKTYGVGGAMDDVGYAIAYSVSSDLLLCQTALRHEGEVVIPFEEQIRGPEMHVWLFFADSRGKQVSRTEYIPLTDPEA